MTNSDPSAVSPADDTMNHPELDAILLAPESSTPESDDVSHNEKAIYTMDTLPRGKSGIYWVRDSDGNISQISVDVPGPDSPGGL